MKKTNKDSSANGTESETACNDCTGVRLERRVRNHSRPPKVPIIPLEKPGRLRVAHLQALFSISHSTVYERVNDGRLPKPDGWDLPGKPKGKRGKPYWNNATIYPLLVPDKSGGIS